MNDSIETIHGVGGSEFVYKKIIDETKLGNLYNRDVKVEIGIMDYGSKVWHSTSKYRRVIWQCNSKFKNDEKCNTPHLC